jgi:hypothetical protein
MVAPARKTSCGYFIRFFLNAKKLSPNSVDIEVLDRLDEGNSMASMSSLITPKLTFVENLHSINMEEHVPTGVDESSSAYSLHSTNEDQTEVHSTKFGSQVLNHKDKSPTSSTWGIGWEAPIAIGGSYLAGNITLSCWLNIKLLKDDSYSYCRSSLYAL